MFVPVFKTTLDFVDKPRAEIDWIQHGRVISDFFERSEAGFVADGAPPSMVMRIKIQPDRLSVWAGSPQTPAPWQRHPHFPNFDIHRSLIPRPLQNYYMLAHALNRGNSSATVSCQFNAFLAVAKILLERMENSGFRCSDNSYAAAALGHLTSIWFDHADFLSYPKRASYYFDPLPSMDQNLRHG